LPKQKKSILKEQSLDVEMHNGNRRSDFVAWQSIELYVNFEMQE
jgi:hypothetical protein